MDSLKCLDNECINLLHKHRLLQPLIKYEFKNSVLSRVNIDKEIENEAINKFKLKFKIKDESDFEKFLKGNGFCQKDFNNLALEDLRTKEYTSNKFANKSEARFLERKNELDIVIYSLIRVNDLSLCRELYLRIFEKEADFGEIASKYSEGIEKRTRGIVGPMSLEKAHPILAEHLRISKIGEVSQPIKINNSHLITRVESYDSAKLDSFMQDKMCEELFEGWLNSQSLSILKELISKTNDE